LREWKKLRTFAAAKAIIALAKCHQYAETERFSLLKRRVGLILIFVCIIEY